ncbi:hypothetical protein BpHYR1_005288 [Brachionus plicatilis]|uniref:Uncharacterized protein n=1 Tax=Brachionus plicatilis TaxID=10195 RepID=A0A3M7S5M7_BRAPC|nr:hypothetical protein BpHYR1_005288 [Brachionus plicatilis]
MKPKKKILKKKLKVKKSEKILVESESPEVNEADEVLNFQTEETVQAEDKFDRPIIDYSVFIYFNNWAKFTG